MSLTNFPNGISSFGIPVIGSGDSIPASTGNYFFVDSGTGNDVTAHGTKEKPFATIDYAIGKCTADNGDVIVVMPGHAETIATASGITADVAGVTIVGLGSGSMRPTISYTLTTSTMVISAADVTVDNIYFNMCDTISVVVNGITISGADVTIKNCEALMSVGAVIATNWITTTVGAMGLKVLNCKVLSPVAGAEEAIKLVGATIGVEIRNCIIAGDFSVAPIHNPTGNVLLNLTVSDCFLKNDQAGDFALELVSACTGFLVRNFYHTNALATAVDPGSCFSMECYACHAVDKNGALTPAGDS